MQTDGEKHRETQRGRVQGREATHPRIILAIRRSSFRRTFSAAVRSPGPPPAAVRTDASTSTADGRLAFGMLLTTLDPLRPPTRPTAGADAYALRDTLREPFRFDPPARDALRCTACAGAGSSVARVPTVVVLARS